MPCRWCGSEHSRLWERLAFTFPGKGITLARWLYGYSLGSHLQWKEIGGCNPSSFNEFPTKGGSHYPFSVNEMSNRI